MNFLLLLVFFNHVKIVKLNLRYDSYLLLNIQIRRRSRPSILKHYFFFLHPRLVLLLPSSSLQLRLLVHSLHQILPQKHLLLLLGHSRWERQPLFIQFKLILILVLNRGLPGEQFSSWSWLPLLLFLLFVRRQYVLLLFDIQFLLIWFRGLRPFKLN